MTLQDTALFARLLVARQAELEDRLRKIEADFEAPRNPDDDDRALERNNDEVLDRLGDSGQKELAAIEAALDRIAHGTFGICARCGGPIGQQRLRTIPHAALCEACAVEG